MAHRNKHESLSGRIFHTVKGFNASNDWYLLNALLSNVLTTGLDDAFKLTIDSVFPKTAKMFKSDEFLQKDEDYPVPGYGDKENMW